MKILIINGSPKKNGTVATLLMEVMAGAESRHEMEWVDVYDLEVRHCVGCMKCRPDQPCVLPQDGGHIMAEKLKSSDALVVGTPTYWGNMSSALKTVFDRNVAALMGEKPNGMPLPFHKGKPAVLVTACTTQWPWNFVASESRGALHALKEVLCYSGFKIKAGIVQPGTKKMDRIDPKVMKKARQAGQSL